MLKLFDTHCHLDDDKFKDDFEQVIKTIKNSPVCRAVCVGANMQTSKQALDIAEQYDFLYAAVGLHPCDAHEFNAENMELLRQMAQHEKVVAIGESGLDYYWDDCPRDVQKQSFIGHIELANELNLPLIVHNRDAHGDTLSILKAHQPHSAIIHCFSGSPEMAKILADMGYYISFSGSVTFKNAKNLPEAVKQVPLCQLLIETDSPYLSPEPFRGKRNDPTKVEFTLRKMADILGMEAEKLSEITFENALKVYNI